MFTCANDHVGIGVVEGYVEVCTHVPADAALQILMGRRPSSQPSVFPPRSTRCRHFQVIKVIHNRMARPLVSVVNATGEACGQVRVKFGVVEN